MASVKVTNGPVSHDGKVHTDGDSITVTEEQAIALVTAGAVEASKTVEAKADESTKTKK